MPDLQEMGDIFPADLQLPTFSRAGDQIDYTFYDRLKLDNAAGAVEREFFTNGVNDTDPVTGNRKTLADTNKRGPSVPEGQAFGVFGLKTRYQGTAAKAVADFQAILDFFQETVCEFTIESKNQYGTWLLDELMDIAQQVVLDSGNTNSIQTGTIATTQGRKPLNLYIPLARLVTWGVTMQQFEAPAASMDDDAIKIEACGILNRRA